MIKYLLSQWQAVELFCKVVCKYETYKAEKGDNTYRVLKMSDFRSNDMVLQTLRRYENSIYYNAFAVDVAQNIANREGYVHHYPKILYNLSHEIRHLVPITRTMDELLILLVYIGEAKNGLKYYRPLDLWHPSNKQRDFENSRWWLYYYEEQCIASKHKTIGVTRAAVHFGSFAKLTINNIDASESEPGKDESYIGSYTIYGGPKEEYLLLEGQLAANNKARDLHILLYIGDNEFKSIGLALGQYHNVNRTIYSGTVILERVIQRGGMKPQFFQREDREVPELYWDFFKNKHENLIKVESGIKSSEMLRKWLDENNGDN